MDVRSWLACIDLRALAEEAGARFGHGQASCCPLHPGADNPSAFHLYRGRDGRARWHCFTRCPQGPGLNDGDAIAFYMRWQRVDFHTAVHRLASRARQAPLRSLKTVTGCLKGGKAAEGHPRGALVGEAAPGERWQVKAREFLAYARLPMVAGRAGRGRLSVLGAWAG